MKTPLTFSWRPWLAGLLKRRSIHRHVGVGTMLVLLALYLVDGWLGYTRAVAQIESRHDRVLERVTVSLLHSVGPSNAANGVDAVSQRIYQEEFGLGALPRLRFRLSDAAGQLVAGETEVAGPDEAAWNTQRPGLHTALYDDVFRGDAVRVCAVRQPPGQGVPTGLTVQVLEPRAARQAEAGAALRDIVWRGGVGLVLAGGLIGILIHWSLSPLRRLRTELVARKPTDPRLLDTERPEELGPLVHALNHLLTAQQAVADQQKRFLADASHQLRTPLAVLSTQLQGLVSHQMNVGETLPKMQRTVERATHLANQLLSLIKVEQLARHGDWAPVDLEAVVRDVALEFAPLMARKRLDFTLESVSTEVASDAWLLGELVRNLLTNAIRHSPASACLGIVLRRLRGQVELIVWDHGGGLDEAAKAHLFKPFSAAKGGTGVGLGLAICRQIAESIHADLDLFNRIEDGRVVGVDAVVRWPLQACAAPSSMAGRPGEHPQAPPALRAAGALILAFPARGRTARGLSA